MLIAIFSWIWLIAVLLFLLGVASVCLVGVVEGFVGKTEVPWTERLLGMTVLGAIGGYCLWLVVLGIREFLSM